MRTLYIFDLDDTLVRSAARVIVRDQNGVAIKKINSRDYHHEHIEDGWAFDFSEFRSASLFSKTTNPINKRIDALNQIVDNKDPSDRVIILTARAKIDDEDRYQSAVERLGIPPNIKTHFSGDETNPGSGTAKVKFLRTMPLELFERVFVVDDSNDSLEKMTQFFIDTGTKGQVFKALKNDTDELYWESK